MAPIVLKVARRSASEKNGGLFAIRAGPSMTPTSSAGSLALPQMVSIHVYIAILILNLSEIVINYGYAWATQVLLRPCSHVTVGYVGHQRNL